MDQQDLWHDNLEDAVRAVVEYIGGPKKVSAALWGGKDPSDGARHLNRCLDVDRNEKLSFGELMWILREGSRKGCHTAMAFIANFCQYEEPKPVTKEQQAATLRQEVLSMGKQLQSALDKLERLEDSK